MLKYCNKFASFKDDPESAVFEVFPKIFADNRGSFCEVMKEIGQWPHDNYPLWFTHLNWIKQINRSKSTAGVIRGLHAQRSPFCQGKLVESLTEPLFDVIVDARPDSSTFGVTHIFKLDPLLQNKLWVPRGFLHGFIVPLDCKQEVIFNYYCNNVYNHSTDFGVCPTTVLPKVIKLLEDGNCYPELQPIFDLFHQPEKMLFSDKDRNNQDYETFMKMVQDEFESTRTLWYK